MTTTLAYDQNFARVESIDGGRVDLSFDLNPERWPWLCLPPQHPVLIEKYQYFSSVTAGWASGLFDPSVHSALTGFKWACPELFADCGHGSRAVSVNRETAQGNIMDIDLFDDADRQLVHMECVGAAFGDRDFEAWRTASKQKARELAGPCNLDFASPVETGLGENGLSLISALLEEGDEPKVTALVTRENGFHPGHPYLTGSGDHVNVGHYFDCVMQIAHLILKPAKPLQCTGGEARFMRFTELDVPFDILLLESRAAGKQQILRFLLSQLGRENAEISLTI